jgi:hypothetical protein
MYEFREEGHVRTLEEGRQPSANQRGKEASENTNQEIP